jgi:hypothetical protein
MMKTVHLDLRETEVNVTEAEEGIDAPHFIWAFQQLSVPSYPRGHREWNYGHIPGIVWGLKN